MRRQVLGMVLDDNGRGYHGEALREEPTAGELDAITRRQAMHVLERVEPDDPPRRPNAGGWVLLCAIVLGALTYALGSLGACVWHR